MRTVFNTDNKDIYKRRLCFAAMFVAAAVLQNTSGLIPEMFGARAMPLIPAAVCVAMFEREISGTLFGAFAGLLWDMSAPSGISFNAVMLAAVGLACGSLITYVMRNNLVTALLLCFVSAVFHLVCYWMKTYIFRGDFKGAVSLLTFYIPSALYTLLWLPVFYFSVRAIMKRFG